MQRITLLVWGTMLVIVSPHAAEMSLDFSKYAVGETPAGFRNLIGGEGAPGDWKVTSVEVPATMAPISAGALVATQRRVLAQTARDATDEHFPMLVFEEETFGDFSLTTRFKIVDGVAEQMAGIAFRLQDENNYYYARASAMGNTVRFYKVMNGLRGPPVGVDINVAKDEWHELSVECKGNRIRCSFNGKVIIPELADNSFTVGKIAFWTKSDAVAYFADAKITYTPRKTLAESLVREILQKYPRLEGIKILAKSAADAHPVVIGSTDPSEVGTSGQSWVDNVLDKDAIYFTKDRQVAVVSMPLHDRNGDTVAAVDVHLKTFIGQTQQNAVARATPIIREMELQIRSHKDLWE